MNRTNNSESCPVCKLPYESERPEARTCNCQEVRERKRQAMMDRKNRKPANSFEDLEKVLEQDTKAQQQQAVRREHKKK